MTDRLQDLHDKWREFRRDRGEKPREMPTQAEAMATYLANRPTDAELDRPSFKQIYKNIFGGRDGQD